VTCFNGREIVPPHNPPHTRAPGDPVEGFKLLSLRKGAAGVDGQTYYLAHIAYPLNTGLPPPPPTHTRLPPTALKPA